MQVKLTRKLALELDGVDLSNNDVGEVVDLPAPEARLLIAESWAIPERRHTGPSDEVVVAFRRDTDLGHGRDEESDS